MVGAPQVRVEYGEDILSNPSPRLSWSVTDAPKGWMQARVEIRDSDQAVTLSGRDSVFVTWPFAPLVHGETRDVSLRVTGTDGSTSPWSTPVSVQLATTPGGFSVQPVSVTDEDVPALLRTELTLRDAPVTARLYATAHGVYQVSIGGVDVDAQILKPGWTPYDLRVLYESTDVTGLLSAGANAIGVRLAPGWYGEGYGFHGQIRRVWTGPLEVAVRLDVTYADGTSETFTTGPGWRGTTQSPVTASGIYPGEDYDARLVQAGWDTAGFGDSLWSDRQQFGDWLDPAAPPESPGDARTHKDIVATACLIRTLDTMVAAARVLGKDPARYEAEAARIREAFQAEYVTPNGRIASDAQTAYAMAIAWNLVPDEKRRARMGERLRELVREGGYIIGTGFVGTPLVCDALTAT